MSAQFDTRAEIERMAALYAPQRAELEVARLRVPPHSIDAEQAVLGGLMLSPESWSLVSDALTAEDFYRRDHALIWQAVSELADARKPFDAVTLGEWFEAHGQSEIVAHGGYLIELASSTPSAANIRAYAEIVADKAGMRRLIDAGTEAVNVGFQPDGRSFAELLNAHAQRIGELQPVQQGGARAVGESLRDWYAEFTERFTRGEHMTGLPTPWHDFNEATHGLQPSTLYLIAGRPSMGKSVVGLQLAMLSVLRGKSVGFFSLEMSATECNGRMVSALADVPHDFIIAPSNSAENSDEYLARMTPAIRDLRTSSLHIDDTPGLTVRQFEARARRLYSRQPLDLMVIDHLHDFRIDPKLARFELGQIAQVCKNLAKEWRIPVIALAQLNREVTKQGDKRPSLKDLRESGELEQKGDVIVLLHREDYYDEDTHLKGVVEMQIAKGRNIRAGKRIHLRNRFDVMRMDDWHGALPEKPEPARTERGFGRSRKQQAAGDTEW